MEHDREAKIMKFVIKQLAEIRERDQISKNALSEISGLSRRSIQLIEEEKRSPTLMSLLKIAHGMNSDLGQIISEAEAIISTQ